MRRLFVLTVSLMLLAGCHSSDAGKPNATGTATSATPSGSPGQNGPSCKDIWRVGAILPKDYTTCTDGAAAGAQDVTKCKDGTKLIAYSDVYYAVTGGTISKPKQAPMQDTLEYGKVFASCTGESD